MSLTQIWGSLVIFVLCPLLGGLPLIDWLTFFFTGRQLSKLGTGNVSVSAAFYHGGRVVGILAVLSEAFKGIAAVLIARAFFPSDPTWELIALIALVMGRYWMGRGAGVTNVVWGIVVHDPIAAFLVLLFGGISFTIFRERRSGRLIILGWVALILILGHPQQTEYIGAAIALVGLLGWIYQKIPDDLDLPTQNATAEAQQVFRFFRGDQAILSLEGKLEAQKVGQKAATLSDLKRCGYAVPDGWILPAGDDPQPLIDFLEPSTVNPLVVRSSAVGEDSAWASAAGQYQTILNVTNREALQSAILECQISYQSPMAMQYRQDRNQVEASMAILIQKQIRGVFSGVAFSRDPVEQFNPAVVIEALPGDATQIVSGKVTPQQYRIEVPNSPFPTSVRAGLETRPYRLPTSEGDVPEALLREVAVIAREIETLYHGIPQDIEWTYDGQQLWILQARAITTLQPIWTRKIAAEVIPGVIRPLTWSINRPLTCGVWGEIFTLVLGKQAQDLDFGETATLHYQRAYFNATLLGEIFRRMGLPAESLEFLTRGAKFSKPPLLTTLRNFPGLFRLLRREWNLDRDFQGDNKRYFAPTLRQLEAQAPDDLAPHVLLERIERILSVLKRATYYSILAPLSLALRQAIFNVSPNQLDNAQTPEVESLRSLTDLAADARNLLPMEQLDRFNCEALFTYLAETPDGKGVLEKFEQWLERYGYLSEVGTDIAVSRWKENPHPARELFMQFLFTSKQGDAQTREREDAQSWKTKLVQKRLNLKGQATAIYSQLLAHLRWSFIALAKHWQRASLFSPTEALFFLELAEIRRLIEEPDSEFKQQLPQLLQHRQIQFQKNQELPYVPYIIYGNPPASGWLPTLTQTSKRRLQGIGASPGQVEGRIKVLRTFQEMTDIDPQTILVVPYTDSGWAPLLARAGGIIAEVGGRLSHGAIIAREYGIPAVMDIHNATQWLRDGQRVRLDGQMGIVEILEG